MQIDPEKVKALLTSKEWKQQTLASKASISLRVLERILQEGKCSPGNANKIAKALDVEIEKIRPGWLDVVIPIGPSTYDESKMPSVEGVKVLAQIPESKGNACPILHQLLKGLEKIEAEIGTVYLLTTFEHDSKQKAALELCWASIPKSNKIRGNRVEIVECNHHQRGGMNEGYLQLCADNERSLSHYVLLHYCDVWPYDDAFYSDLVQSHRDSIPNPSRQKTWGGVFGCALRVPFNFLTDPEDIAKRLQHHRGTIGEYVSHVHKPFHRVRVSLTWEGIQRHVYLNNMAIAVVSTHVLQAIGRKSPDPGGRQQELFEMIQHFERGLFQFAVCMYRGEWAHADTDDDLDIIRTQVRESQISQ